MWKILIFLTIVLCVQSTGVLGGSLISKVTRKPPTVAVTTTQAARAAAATTKTTETTTMRILSTVDKHRHHHGITTSRTKENKATPPPTTTASPRKIPLNKQEDLPISIEPEASKRNSRIIVVEKTPEINKKSIEIELKAFTPPPNEPAFIEVLPDSAPSNSWPIPCSTEWQGIPCYPPQQNVQYQMYWNFNQQNQDLPRYEVSYIPTEELLHRQSFTNNYDVNPVFLYPYPAFQPPDGQPRSVRFQPTVLKDILIKDSKNWSPKPEIGAESTAESTTEVPDTTIISKPQNDNPFVMNQQNNVQTQWIPYPEDVLKAFSINTGTNSGHNPEVVKLVTRSYYLRTYPKLEWVPL